MITLQRKVQLSLAAAVSALVLLSAGCMHNKKGSEGMSPVSPTSSTAPMATASLTGAQEEPANPSSASGKSTIKIAGDKSVSGMVTISGMTATAAHIHEGAKGTNGPVIIPLTKTSDTTFTVPANAALNDAQYTSFKAGNLYINVHSATYPGGEIRAQISPN